MKSRYLFFSVFLLFLFSCEKSEEPDQPVSSAVIDGNSFSPSEITAQKSSGNLLFVFQDGDKSIEILTSDVVAGDYEVTGELLKSGDLKANMKYQAGGALYNGVSGLVTVTIDGNVFSGSYAAELESESGTAISVSSGTFSGIEATEGDLILSEKLIQEGLDDAYNKLKDYIQFEYLFDAVYANRVEAPDNSWSAVYDHSQTPDDSKVSMLWNDAFDLLNQVNLLMESAEQVIATEETRKLLEAQGFAIRAYLNLKLMKWFGALPVVDEPFAELPPRNMEEQVIDWINHNGDFAVAFLPESWPGEDSDRMTKSFALGVLSRTALRDEDFAKAFVYSSENMSSGNHSLGSSNGNFQADNPEIYWGFAKADNQEFNDFFSKGDYVPAFRHTETYLLAATAGFLLGNASEALTYVNALRARRGEPDLTVLTLDDLYLEFNTELNLEGESFFLMKIFDKVDEELQLDGYRYLLPIPSGVLEANPDIAQNQGY
jgi:hypothetical protein